ncbi:MAG: 30S ribosomal protein S17 [Nanoarchaeota archaeon]|nr:30S ribosomal protein S17 [Nanoarchaeota archaeon]
MVKKETKSECEDKNCPIHGSLKTRGRSFKGVVVSSKAQKSAVVEWARLRKDKKYERYEKRRTKVQVHNPECINAKEGDNVIISECRPLSKTKQFVITSLVKDKVKETPTKVKTEKKETKKQPKKVENKSE